MNFFKLIMLLFAQEAIKYVAIRYRNSLSPCITCVQHSHAEKWTGWRRQYHQRGVDLEGYCLYLQRR